LFKYYLAIVETIYYLKKQIVHQCVHLQYSKFHCGRCDGHIELNNLIANSGNFRYACSGR